MYQNGTTPLKNAAASGHLSAIEYLVERGADIQAKDVVSDVISLMWSHTYVTHEYMCVNVSEWIHSIDGCCKGRSFTSG